MKRSKHALALAPSDLQEYVKKTAKVEKFVLPPEALPEHLRDTAKNDAAAPLSVEPLPLAVIELDAAASPSVRPAAAETGARAAVARALVVTHTPPARVPRPRGDDERLAWRVSVALWLVAAAIVAVLVYVA